MADAGKAKKKAWSERLYDTCRCPPDKGHSHPRLFPRPLRELTPDTSLGFSFLYFCKSIGLDLLPWQKFLAVHALELKENGEFRFREVVFLLPRQNGKSTFVAMLLSWLLTVRQTPLILGAAQNLQTAEEIWNTVGNLIETHPTFKGELARPITLTNGAKCITLTGGRRYMPIAAVGGAGRGLSPQAVFLDEIREHHDWQAYAALSKAMMAQKFALLIAASNAGDAKSVVLSHLVAQGREMIFDDAEEGVGLFDFSAYDFDDKEGDPSSFEFWRRSNPSLGYTVPRSAIQAAYNSDPLPVFLTEVLCIPVEVLDAVIDVGALFLTVDPFQHTLQPAMGKRQIIAHLEVSPDLMHVALVGAAPRDDGSTTMQVLKTWAGTSAIDELEKELPALLKVLKPRQIQRYVGNSGSQAVARIWKSITGTKKVDLTMAQASEHSVRFAAMVSSGKVKHPGSSLLVSQARAAVRKQTGDTWRFARTSKEGQYVTALYASAGACYISEEYGKVVTTPILV